MTLLILLVSGVFWWHGQAAISGRITGDGRIVTFLSDNGLEYTIEPGAAGFLKYTNFRIQILDPVHPTSDTIRFQRYRILESDAGETVNSSIRTIMRIKNKRPRMELRIHQTPVQVRFSLCLSNSGDAPISLRFPSTQRYDLVVMTADQQKTLWRWSWGQEFEIGFNDYVIPTSQEIRFVETWAFADNYIEDGEYIVFAELHCLPHGILSDVQRIVLQNPRSAIQFQEYCIPMKLGNYWTFHSPDLDENCRMEITGLFHWEDREYFIFSFFPDSLRRAENGLAGTGNSRILRFDTGPGRFMEWTPDGEKPLLMTDRTHRLRESAEGCRTAVGTFKHCLEYQVLVENEWQLRYRFVPGIGLTFAEIYSPAAPPVRLEITDFHFRTSADSVSLGEARVTTRPPAAHLILKKRGGFPAEDILYSLKSDGTFAVQENGTLVDHGIFPPSELWNMIQIMEDDGLFHLRENYGERPVEDPLIIELTVQINGSTKRVAMQTSPSDKPPLVFWKIIDNVEKMIHQYRQ
ncbi:MAG: hypothetical protein JXQ27_10635 [Acidobacteria bacterium]|nr:hypothetical protein [Acidobacteriota bacterium]